jgi:hypothetical protein
MSFPSRRKSSLLTKLKNNINKRVMTPTNRTPSTTYSHVIASTVHGSQTKRTGISIVTEGRKAQPGTKKKTNFMRRQTESSDLSKGEIQKQSLGTVLQA